MAVSTITKKNNNDLTPINATGTTNTTGKTIGSETYFYLNGELVKSVTSISSGATFAASGDNKNYEVVTAGGLNAIHSYFKNYGLGSFSTNISDVEAAFLTFHNNQTKKINGRMLPIGFTTSGTSSNFSPLSTTNYAGFYIQLNSSNRFKIICWPGNNSIHFYTYNYAGTDNHTWSTFSRDDTYSTLSPTISSTYINTGSSNTEVHAGRLGNIVTLSFDLVTKTTIQNTNALITNLPAPATEMTIAVSVGSSSGGRRLRLNSSGQLTAWYQDIASGLTISGSITYIAA